jgi:hypothetical protein
MDRTLQWIRVRGFRPYTVLPIIKISFLCCLLRLGDGSISKASNTLGTPCLWAMQTLAASRLALATDR